MCSIAFRAGTPPERLAQRAEKRPGQAEYLASAEVKSRGPALKAVSTNMELAMPEIVRLYGRHRDIEPSFKVLKGTLNPQRAMESRDFDALIGHITVALCRYLFLTFERRCHDDPRPLGSLFYVGCEEQKDLSFLEALGHLLAEVVDKLRQAGQNLKTQLSDLFP